MPESTLRVAYLNSEDLRKTAGGKVHFWAVATELSRLGLSVDVVAPKYGRVPWNATEADERIHLVPLRVSGKSALGLLTFELLLLLLLPWFKIRRGWNVLLVRGGGASFLLGLVFLMSRLMRIRVVVECNGVVWEEYRARGYPAWFCTLIKLMAWQQVVTANAIIGVTPAIRDCYSKLAGGVDGYAISNGVFTEKIPFSSRQQFRQEKGWGEDVSVFVMPSEFAPWHGIRQLVEAISLIPPAEMAQMRFVLPGSGCEFEGIRDLVQQKHLEDRVDLPGRLGRDDVYRLLAAADVGLLFTQASGIPGSSLKLFEYLGAGLHTIACRDSYLEGLIPFYGFGVLLSSATPAIIAAALGEAARSHPGEEQRLAVRQIAEKEFHWRQVARRVAAVLKGEKPELEEWMLAPSKPTAPSERKLH